MANKSTQYGQPNGNIPHKLTVEELRKGAEASHEKHRQNKTWKQILDMLGEKQVRSQNNRKMLSAAQIPSDEQISDVAKMFILDSKSQAGDMKALELEAKIRGLFAPVKNLNENHNIDVTPLVDLTKRIKNGEVIDGE